MIFLPLLRTRNPRRFHGIDPALWLGMRASGADLDLYRRLEVHVEELGGRLADGVAVGGCDHLDGDGITLVAMVGNSPIRLLVHVGSCVCWR